MRCRRGDDGSVPVEVAMVAPPLLFLLMLVMYAARVADAETEVQAAAAAAARAASLESNPVSAEAAATEAGEKTILDAGITCAPLTIELLPDSNLSPGGIARVRAVCHAEVSDVALVYVPGNLDFEAVSSEVVDTYRGGQ